MMGELHFCAQQHHTQYFIDIKDCSFYTPFRQKQCPIKIIKKSLTGENHEKVFDWFHISCFMR